MGLLGHPNGDTGTTTGFLNLDNGNGQAYIGTNNDMPLVVSLNENNGAVEWTFGTDGTLQTPYYKFPGTAGNAGQVLVNDGSGNLTWQDQTGGGANLGHLYVDFDNTILSTDSSSYINFDANGYEPHALAVGTNGAFPVRIETNWEGGAQSWKFDIDGNLTLPPTDMTASPAPTSWPGITFSDGTFQNTAYTGTDNGITIANTAPAGTNGKLWFNSTDARTYIKYNGVYVDASPAVIPLASTYTGELAIEETTISNTDWTGTKDIIVENGGKSWKFTSAGEVVFPDNTVQTTAYTAAPILEIDGGDASTTW